ncbi:hypothetical protein TELCIR_12558, partial [Teladorsagia circumcincta]
MRTRRRPIGAPDINSSSGRQCLYSGVEPGSFCILLNCPTCKTLAAGLLLMTISAQVPAYTVLLALVATAVTCGGIIAYASQTTFDITSKIFIIYAVSLAVFIFGIGVALASIFVHVKWLGVIFSAIVCMLFMVHLALDTQMILGGRKYEISPEEYIYAALILFVDIYEIFGRKRGLVDFGSPQPSEQERALVTAIDQLMADDATPLFMILEEDAEKQSSYDSSHNETSSDTSKNHTSVESEDQTFTAGAMLTAICASVPPYT